MADAKQDEFVEFSVPDPQRINKVYDWLDTRGYLAPGMTDLSVLEIGYSRGGLLDRLNGLNHVNKFAVDINKRHCAEDITFYEHDCNQGLPEIPGTVFDIVFAGEVMEHIVDDESFLTHIHDNLSSGGILALTVPHLFFLVNRLVVPFGKMPYFSYAPFHYHMYSLDTITSLLTRTGFNIRHVRSSHILVSSRRFKRVGRVFEFLGDVFPRFGAHLIVFAEKSDGPNS